MSQIVNVANVRRTISYVRKNGTAAAFYAARERIAQKRAEHYEYEPLDEQEKLRQKEEAVSWREFGQRPYFSILVPTYETKELYLRQLIESVLAQTFENWELILADASASQCVKAVVADYADERIRYIKLEQNGGISDNTNAALREARGVYTGLLDHDDLLTEDALFEMAGAIRNAAKNTAAPALLYSDEDKTDRDGKRFYDVHRKLDFNLDLLLSNNYICHFLVARTELMQECGLRKLYDGAQDYDLILQLVKRAKDRPILHIKKVLYHWRCHENSTAENPTSKMYAYEAGRKAVYDFCMEQGWRVWLRHARHLGFYQVEYQGDVFAVRKDIGAVGGRILSKGKVVGGAYLADGSILYEGLPKQFSGEMHRAVLQQDVDALDVRFMQIRREVVPILQEVIEQVTGQKIQREVLEQWQREAKISVWAGFDQVTLKEISLLFGERLRAQNYKLLYDPKREWKQ